ncbi:MAG: cytochrome c [Candidatus Rokubacteria bacterium]|nr:cytochrome c [Candidatus Rokubacteria bacterium]
MKRKWLLIIAGPAALLAAGSLAASLVLPHPIPRTATPAQRLYLTHCASCHGANGQGSWRATLLLIRPGNLADPRVTNGMSDEYLHALIRNGGATIGMPGMPAFGFHLSEEQVQGLVRHLRALGRG